MIVTQVTRGLAPARSIANVVETCYSMGIDYWLIEGLSMVDGHNRCVEISDEAGDDVLMLQDDVIVTEHHLGAARFAPGIAYAPCNLKNGYTNTVYRKDGSTLYSGLPFLFLPRHVRQRLEPKVFDTGEHVIDKPSREIIYKGPSEEGKHADVWFWCKFNELDPRPDVLELPPVTHIIHDLSSSYVNMSNLREV